MNFKTLFFILSASLSLQITIPNTDLHLITSSSTLNTTTNSSLDKITSPLQLLIINDSIDIHSHQHECLICQEDMLPQELYKSFECTHKNIHKSCVTKYIEIAKENARCPLCRAQPIDSYINLQEPYVIQRHITSRTTRNGRPVANECDSLSGFVELKNEFLNLIQNVNARFTMEIFHLCQFTINDMLEFIDYATLVENWTAALSLFKRVRNVHFDDLNVSFVRIIAQDASIKQLFIKELLTATDRPSHLQVREAHYQCLVQKDAICNKAFLEWYETRAEPINTTPVEPRIDHLIEEMFRIEPKASEWVSIAPLLKLPRSIISLGAISTIMEVYSASLELLDDITYSFPEVVQMGMKLDDVSMSVVLRNVFWKGDGNDLYGLLKYKYFTKNNVVDVFDGFMNASLVRQDLVQKKEEKIAMLLRYKNGVYFE